MSRVRAGRSRGAPRIPLDSVVTEPKQLPETLDKAALGYLERFDTSVANLRRVLRRKAQKLAPEQADESFVAQCIDELLARYQRSGLLDDLRYAEGIACGLRNRGLGERAIKYRLKAKGVDDVVIGQALERQDASSEEPELEAALRFIKRRRLGKHRSESNPKAHHRDLSALARAGFSYEVARQALGRGAGDDEDVL